jgi:trigger factor
MDIRISVEETGELDRLLHVRFPGEVVDEAIEARLRALGRTLVLRGHRPGRVPFPVIRDRYGTEVRRQVLQEQLQKVCRTATEQAGLDAAGPARVQQKGTEPGEHLSFHADFDVYPDITC